MRKAERFKVWVTSLAKLSFSLDPLSSPLWRINLDVMFTALVDFVEEPVGFKILYTTQSRSSTVIA